MPKKFIYNRDKSTNPHIEHILSYIDHRFDNSEPFAYDLESFLRGQQAINDMEYKLSEIENYIRLCDGDDTEVLNFVKGVLNV